MHVAPTPLIVGVSGVQQLYKWLRLNNSFSQIIWKSICAAYIGLFDDNLYENNELHYIHFFKKKKKKWTTYIHRYISANIDIISIHSIVTV